MSVTVIFISTLRETSVNKKDLRDLSLVGSPSDKPETDPLVVPHIDNQLKIKKLFLLLKTNFAREF